MAGSFKCDKVVALLLCIFLGFLGIHKFYEKKPIWGVVYIFTLGLFLVGWIIDIVVLLKRRNRLYTPDKSF